MTLKEIVRAYRRDGRLKRPVAKDLAKQLRAGNLASAMFAGSIPFPVLEDAYRRFGSRYPLRYDHAWSSNALAALQAVEARQKLAAQGKGNPVAVPVAAVEVNQAEV